MPRAAERAVPAWPAPKLSCSLSARVRNRSGRRSGGSCRKARPAAGEQLVDVALVGDVEDELVFRGGEDAVQGDGQLDHAEVGADVAAVDGGDLEDLLADLLRRVGQLFRGECLEVVRTLESASRSATGIRVSRTSAMCGRLKVVEGSGIGVSSSGRSVFAGSRLFEEFDLSVRHRGGVCRSFRGGVSFFVFAQQVGERDFPFLHRFDDFFQALNASSKLGSLFSKSFGALSTVPYHARALPDFNF
jgi:hypothetical protein